MSLGSKELFHSNFWAYLIRTNEYRRLIHAFFKDFDLQTFDKVERENKHRDLTIFDKNGKEYLIENKIKSYPDEDQLKEYSGGSFIKGSITGIKEHPFKLDKWKFTSYSEIASNKTKRNKRQFFQISKRPSKRLLQYP